MRLIASGIPFFLLISGYYFLKPLRNGMFLSELGPEQLPYFYLLVSFVALAVSIAHRWFSRMITTKSLVAYYGLGAIVVLLFFGISMMEKKSIGGPFFVWLSSYNVFSVSVFWSGCHILLDRPRAKNYLAVFGLGGVLGGIYGSFAADYFSKNILTQDTLAYLLGLGMVHISAAFLLLHKLLPEKTPEEISAFTAEITHPGKTTSSWILVFAGLAVMFAVASATFLDYEHAKLVRALGSSSLEITAYYSKFFLGVNAFALVAQVVLVPLVFKYTRGFVGLCFLPLFALGSFWSLFQGLEMVTVFQTLAAGSAYSINQTSRERLMSLLSFHNKVRLKVFVDLFCFRCGDSMAAICLLPIVATIFSSYYSLALVMVFWFLATGVILRWAHGQKT